MKLRVIVSPLAAIFWNILVKHAHTVSELMACVVPQGLSTIACGCSVWLWICPHFSSDLVPGRSGTRLRYTFDTTVPFDLSSCRTKSERIYKQGFRSFSRLLTVKLFSLRNVNPSTSLLLPWSFAGNLGDAVGVKGAYYETGLRAGSGVLAVSSAGMTFVEASGRRASLPLHLDGLATCGVRIPENRLVTSCSSSLRLSTAHDCFIGIGTD